MFAILFAVFVLITSLVVLLRYCNKAFIKRKRCKIFDKIDKNWKPKSRSQIITSLKNSAFDILIVGGGSVGVGCAIDAATRGLKVGLIEANDFGCGTSSKSTKMLHGGIRYLEKAVNDLDKSQYELVKDALKERYLILKSCPFLCRPVQILFPVYKRILIPYYYLGLKLYDWLAGTKSIGKSRFLTQKKTVELFPHIRAKNLRGSILYYDGQFYDAKMNVLLAITASYYGAEVINHVKLTKINQTNGKITSVTCYDSLGKEEFEINCKILVNTAGPLCDGIRQMSNKKSSPILQQSLGTHIVVPAIFSPKNLGFVDPSTHDKRIAFFVNYKGKTLIGATDVKCTTDKYLKPSEEDLNFLIHEANYYTDDNLNLTKDDVLAVWTGIRPLVKDTTKQDTEKIVRKFSINIEDNNLVSIFGGKWTVYRLMAEDAINQIVEKFNLKCKVECITPYLKVIGSQGYNKTTEQDLAYKLNIPNDIAKHLATSYGTKAYKMGDYFNTTYTRLTDAYPYTMEEVRYCLDNEMAYKISDVLFNRFQIPYVDVRKAHDLVEPIGKEMQKYFSWSDSRFDDEIYECMCMLDSCGYNILQ